MFWTGGTLFRKRIFEILNDRGMTQKEFAIKTGIAESTISDWKRRGANPAAENIMKISQVLGVDVEELLSGVVKRGKRGRIAEYRIVTAQSPEGMLLEQFDRLDNNGKQRLMGYLEAMVGRDN